MSDDHGSQVVQSQRRDRGLDRNLVNERERFGRRLSIERARGTLLRACATPAAWRGGVLGALLVVEMMSLTPLCLARAEDTPPKTKVQSLAWPPLPPARPADLPTGPSVPSPSATQPDAPKDPAARTPAPGETTADLSPYRMHKLPPATRARMHECGEEWQQMKTTGAALDKTWYTFAQTCLSR
jgi:hypothetical protein